MAERERRDCLLVTGYRVGMVETDKDGTRGLGIQFSIDGHATPSFFIDAEHAATLLQQMSECLDALPTTVIRGDIH